MVAAASKVDFRRSSHALESLFVDLRGSLDKIIAEASDSSYGPETVQTPVGSLAGQAGEGGAVNLPDAIERVNLYLDGIVNSLNSMFGLSEDEAIEYVFDCADEANSAGLMPAFPYDGEASIPIMLWLGSAQSQGFQAAVLKKATEALGAKD